MGRVDKALLSGGDGALCLPGVDGGAGKPEDAADGSDRLVGRQHALELAFSLSPQQIWYQEH